MMGGGSGTGFGVCMRKREDVSIELSVKDKVVLYISGNYITHPHEENPVVDWNSGGSSIGAYLSPGKKPLNEQRDIVSNLAKDVFCNDSYEVNVVSGRSAF